MKYKKYPKIFSALLAICIVFSLFSMLALYAQADTNEIRVSTAKELMQAMRYASPGDEIIVAPGEYVGALGTGSNGSGYGSAWFYSNVDGTAEKPITVRCEDPANKPLLKGSRTSGMVMYITGDYWIIDGFDMSIGQKGLLLDNSNNTIIKNCDIHDVSMEGLHLRDGSSYCLVENCKVYNTGLVNKGMGEGIYVGSDKGKWGEFNKDCNYNVIRSCELGPNVDSEHVDVKEGTVGTIVEYCIMHGTGVSGGNYADSFIDAKGNDGIYRYNTCYQEGNDIIVDAFQTHNQIEDWGNRNVFVYNTIVLTNSSCCIVNGHTNVGTLYYGNTCNQANGGNKGNVTELTKEQADQYAGQGPSEPPEVPVLGMTVEEVGLNSKTGSLRTVYSLSDPNKECVAVGLVYCVDSSVEPAQITVGAAGTYACTSTSAGLLSQDGASKTYAMSMNTGAFTGTLRVRAFALLETGKYIYSDAMEYVIP